MKKRIGIVGGGQLGRMLAQAAKGLDLTVIVLDPTPNSPAGQVADRQIIGDFKDPAAIRELAKEVDALTFETESANADVLRELEAGGMAINPSPDTLVLIKDKLAQKIFLRDHDIPVADFREVTTADDIETVAEAFGYPLLVKARFDSYDGRGNAVVRNVSEIPAAMEKLGGRALYCEKFVPFTKELAVMAARGANDQYQIYPVVETIQRNNICHIVKAPAPVEEKMRDRAQDLALHVMQHLSGWGVFGIELFLTEAGDLVVNEIAPRVHNSGHYTIEACATSQFRQHILAVMGQPLEDASMRVPAAVMVNILGERSGEAQLEGLAHAQDIPQVVVHMYGKIETRSERKMGHVTAVADTLEEAHANAEKARRFISI